MEVPEEEARSLQGIHSQRICLMEAPEAWTKKFVASERKHRMEAEKEAPCLHVFWLGHQRANSFTTQNNIK